jgi:predicted nucleotidyltransferase
VDTAVADLPPKAAEFARILQEHMPELEREYGVASLALFGSYVRGEEREDSDLDVLVDFRVTPSLLDLEFARILQEHMPELASLQRNLSNYLETPIDLVPKTGLRKTIGARILREAVEV